MQVHAGCVIPEELLYDLVHDNWARVEDDGTVRLGMTDLSQTRCGKIVSISFRRIGKHVPRGRPLAVIESAKWVGPFPAPLSGTIIATNADTFAADGLIANKDPYGAGWLVRIEPDRLDDERDELVDGLAAFEPLRERIQAEGISCMRCAD